MLRANGYKCFSFTAGKAVPAINPILLLQYHFGRFNGGHIMERLLIYLEIHQEHVMYDLTGFQRDLLICIAGLDTPSGQDLKEELEDSTNLTNVNHGRLYPNLDTLVNKELVEKGELDRRTNYYAITEKGEGRIQDRREWENQYIQEIQAI